MDDDTQPLSFYNPQANYTIHVVDESGQVQMNQFDDVSGVEKYKISEENYAKRGDNFRNFKAKMSAQICRYCV